MLTPWLVRAASLALLLAPVAGQSPKQAIVREGATSSGEPIDFALPELDPARLWSVTAVLPRIPDPGVALMVELFDPAGMPTGKVLHAGDPDMHFVYRPRAAGASILRVRRVESKTPVIKAIEDATRFVGGDRRVAALVQDDARLATALYDDGDGDARLIDTGAWSGASALRVEAGMRIARNVPGWGYRIAEDPKAGEFRYLRFAWKLERGETAMVALADQGELGDPADGRLRYVVGTQLASWGATIVGDAPPREWTVVTRDLWRDRGDFTLTGMGLLPCGGVLLLDHCYLGRTLADLDAVTPLSVRAAMQSGDREGLRAIPASPPHTLRGPFVSYPDPLAWRVEIRALDVEGASIRRFESEPNDQWNYASEIDLGTEVRGGADDIEYLDNEEEGRVGWDWFRFSWNGDRPTLAFFTLDCPDRDVPATIRIYMRDEVGRLVPYVRGKDPTEVRHDNQDASIAGWKFVTRVLGKGDYWLHVKANHPSYTLRTKLYDPPPYDDPRAALRVAADYLAQAGDSFFANVPRGGAVRTRAQANTDETTRCFACHAGHYPVIANLAAHRNGYRVVESAPFRNLVDRIYEVGVPLYGHEEATWARFDLAPTVGIARVGTMICEFEESVSGRRTDAILGPARFAELVYRERAQLPQGGDRTAAGNFEFDGNRPIPDARVATEAWRLFDALADRTGKEEWRALADHMSNLIATARVKDNEDLVEQSLGMLAMDSQRHAAAITANMQQLLARIHDDGGWVTAEYLTNLQVNELQAMAALDQPQAPSLTFFTAMAAHALLRTGMPSDDVERSRLLDRAARLLLSRQLEFGGWIDPQGELFRTPYLETHWVVIFLAHLFPEPVVEAMPVAAAAGDSLLERLDWLSAQWVYERPEQVRSMCAMLADGEPLLRTGAALALQRVAWRCKQQEALAPAIGPLAAALSDINKSVARAAAQALRALGSNAEARAAIAAALASAEARTRRGALRVFAHRFSELANHVACREAVLSCLDDPDFAVRIAAVQSAQRWWYQAKAADKPAILARILARARHEGEMAVVRGAIEKAIYDICDENTAELYGNDARVMATDAHRHAIRHARDEVVERGIADQLVATLQEGARTAQSLVLRALGRRIANGLANGNDTDDVVFLGMGGVALAQEILKLLRDPEPETREAAAWATTAVRGHADAAFVGALIDAAGSPFVRVRTAALRGLDVVEIKDQDLPKHGVPIQFLGVEAQQDEPAQDRTRATLRWLRRDPSSQRLSFVPDFVRLLSGSLDLETRKLALQNLEWAAVVHSDAVARAAIWAALFADDASLRTEAEVQIERAHATGGALARSALRWDYVTSAVATRSAEHHERACRFALWDDAAAPWDRIVPHMEALLEGRRPRLRADALDLALRARAAGFDVDVALRAALRLPDAQAREKAAVALGLDPKAVPAPKLAVERVDSPLDFDTFAAFVHPVLMKQATTGAKGCVECHRVGANEAGSFALVAAEDGAPSDVDLVRNYNAAVAFVDPAEASKSPLLLKPLNPDRAIGALHGTGHGGGVSWSEPTDPDFRSVFDWASGKKLDRGEKLFFEEFRAKIVPIFTEIGPTGDACWECHNTHNTLFMPEPENGETFNAQESRFLLDYVMRVVDLKSPESSLVLNEPLYELDSPFREKDPNRPTHGGGIRWLEGKRSWQYRAMLEWIERVAGKR